MPRTKGHIPKVTTPLGETTPTFLTRATISKVTHHQISSIMPKHPSRAIISLDNKISNHKVKCNTHSNNTTQYISKLLHLAVAANLSLEK
jgi:hypothetical protein